MRVDAQRVKGHLALATSMMAIPKRDTYYSLFVRYKAVSEKGRAEPATVEINGRFRTASRWDVGDAATVLGRD
jgi:hypothetical protein